MKNRLDWDKANIYCKRQSLKKSGILINSVNINNIRYADDTVILAESEEQLQAMLDRIVDKCKEYGMEINAKKTKTMHIGRDTKTLTITVRNARLEHVSKYSYLRHMITDDVATLKEMQIRIEKTTQKFWENKELLRRNVGPNTKKRILACYVLSVFNYGCEAWTYSKTVQKKIQTFEMWCCRRLLKVPWTEKKQRKKFTNGRCWRKTVTTICEAETWVCWSRHERQLRTFATSNVMPRLENRRDERTGKAKKELDGRCKGMARDDKLWRYQTEGREQRRMERHGCQPWDRRRHLITIIKLYILLCRDCDIQGDRV
ncbi:endonuclease-reverse transcriptase [Elysia marginata]|uniref:Endonuclease-reverse transcriptase n=1 Tax=Elysia marginata TaxID=1093978 RepID=A0AAV4FSH3_9GAST|nr:endonuclease-reverse transcriptase [Elysia marginata]